MLGGVYLFGKSVYQWTRWMCSKLCTHATTDRSSFDLSAEGSQSFEPLIDGSDPCFTHRSSVGDWTESVLRTQLVYLSLRNDVLLKPYSVFYDRLRDEVVISIRGTLSLEDCITDIKADPAPLYVSGEVWGGDNTPRWAHEGMLRAAKAVYQDLQSNRILDRIQSSRNSLSAHTPLHTVSLHCHPIISDISKYLY